jgi:single-strand DNA-binding protein
MNQLSLIGNLTRDPILRHTATGHAVCDLRIAVNGMRDDVLYLDLATFDGQAEACARYLAKGRQVGFEGQLVYSEWIADDGTKRSKHSGIGRVQFLSRQRSAEDIAADEALAAAAEAGEIADEKIPF